MSETWVAVFDAAGLVIGFEQRSARESEIAFDHRPDIALGRYVWNALAGEFQIADIPANDAAIKEIVVLLLLDAYPEPHTAPAAAHARLAAWRRADPAGIEAWRRENYAVVEAKRLENGIRKLRPNSLGLVDRGRGIPVI